MNDFVKCLVAFIIIGIIALNVSIFFFHPADSGYSDYTLSVKEKGDSWFYEIHKNSKILIKQETIPAISGNFHFASKLDAEKIGNIVLQKLREGYMPPTISLQEIEESHIQLNRP